MGGGRGAARFQTLRGHEVAKGPFITLYKSTLLANTRHFWGNHTGPIVIVICYGYLLIQPLPPKLKLA